MIVALGYQSRVGKDTLAGMLVEQLASLGVTARRASFASALKGVAHEAFVHYGLRGGAFYDTPEGAPLRTAPLDRIGKTPIELWIALGEACKAIHPAVWLDRVFDAVEPGEWVVLSDLRFPLEAAEVRRRGGVTVLVERPGQATHASDHALHAWEWDVKVRNEGSLGDLRADARALAKWLTEGGAR